MIGYIVENGESQAFKYKIMGTVRRLRERALSRSLQKEEELLTNYGITVETISPTGDGDRSKKYTVYTQNIFENDAAPIWDVFAGHARKLNSSPVRALLYPDGVLRWSSDVSSHETLAGEALMDDVVMAELHTYVENKPSMEIFCKQTTTEGNAMILAKYLQANISSGGYELAVFRTGFDQESNTNFKSIYQGPIEDLQIDGSTRTISREEPAL